MAEFRHSSSVRAERMPGISPISGRLCRNLLLPSSWHEICIHAHHLLSFIRVLGEDCVLHKCANPACGANFRDLNRGKLFAVENPFPAPLAALQTRKRPSRHVEHYWLCDRCSSALTLVFEPGRGIATMPLQPKIDRSSRYSASA